MFIIKHNIHNNNNSNGNNRIICIIAAGRSGRGGLFVDDHHAVTITSELIHLRLTTVLVDFTRLQLERGLGLRRIVAPGRTGKSSCRLHRSTDPAIGNADLRRAPTAYINSLVPFESAVLRTAVIFYVDRAAII